MIYATLFDSTYLLRGVTMIESLLAVAPDSQISVLALDWETASVLHDRRDELSITILTLSDLNEQQLWAARQTRSYRDFCWTLGSVVCNRLLHDHEEVIYLDADILFFNSPTELITQCRVGQIAAIRHDFPSRLRFLERNGIFNVQWVYFAGPEGRLACQEWMIQCLERCELAPEEGIVGDQKYLDEWPSKFPSFVQIDDPGCGVAPWNHEERRPRQTSGRWHVNSGHPLIFFHFHGFRISASGEITMAADIYSEELPLPCDLYADYLKRLASNWDKLRHLIPEPEPKLWSPRRPEGLVSRTFGRLQASWRKRRAHRRSA